MLMIFGTVEIPNVPVDSYMPPATIGDEVHTEEVAAAESEAETDEEQLGVDEEASYEGLTEVDEAMVDAAVQISLADTPMADPTGPIITNVTPGTDAHGIWIEEQSKDTNLQNGMNRAERRKKREPEKNQVGERKKKSAIRQGIPRCRVRSPKVIDLEDVEGQEKKAMELTKGQIAELIGEPDLLRRVALRNIFLATINTFLNI
uniref:Polyprotein protein n=1 Tax=Solanum tuberosum TaxID=4113 RepID=M1DEC7_SOLTU